jgi:hypothetical protein
MASKQAADRSVPQLLSALVAVLAKMGLASAVTAFLRALIQLLDAKLT